jgi:hypothetical protein
MVNVPVAVPVVPLVGVTLSQGLVALLVAVAVKARAVLVLLPTMTVCAAGDAAPTVDVNESELLLSVSAPEVTCNVTGMVIGLFATAVLPTVAAMVMDPL